MNILPKKNWHVRTKKNIDKVRKDEAKAAEEERKLNDRIALAEREARTDYLRTRARDGQSSTKSESNHVNLFADSQLGRGDQRINLEHEKEEKLRKEKWEQQVGILTYLHKSQSDIDNPWYLQPHEERLHGTTVQKSRLGVSKDDESKVYHDPLTTMRQYLSKMKSSDQSNQTTNSKHSKNSKDDHKKRKHTDEQQSVKGADDKMAELRRQRLEREKKEKRRAEKLIAKHRPAISSPGQSSVSSTPRTTDERKIRFHSQFNPHLAKH